MVQRQPTPEEQLLKLIEGGGGAKTPAPEAKKDTPAPPAASPLPKAASGKKKAALPSIGILPGIVDYWGKLFSKKKAAASQGPALRLDLKTANRGILVLVIGSVLYLLTDLFFMKPGSADFLSQVSVSDRVYPLYEQAAGESPKDLTYYSDALMRRNPFLAPQAPGTSEDLGMDGSGAGESPALQGSPIQELLQGYKLVGISMGEEPLAMIEEVNTGRTFFLRTGQETHGMKVQSISKEKVVLTYEGQEGELF